MTMEATSKNEGELTDAAKLFQYHSSSLYQQVVPVLSALQLQQSATTSSARSPALSIVQQQLPATTTRRGHDVRIPNRERMRMGRQAHHMQRLNSTVSHQIQDIPFHSRDIDHVLSMDYDFLDTDLDDLDNIPEDQQLQSDEQATANEDSEFEDGHHEVGQSHQSRTKRSKGQHHKKNGNWSTENLESALNNVDEGMPIHLAAKLAGIPASSVRDHYIGKTRGRKRGPVGVLTMEEEEDLKLYLLKMHTLGHPLTRDQVKLTVAQVTQTRPTPFINGIPGNGWMRWFLHRHPDLSFRKSQALETGRARGLCKESVQSLYSNLELLYSNHHYEAHQIWNADESGAQAGRNGGGMVVAKTGSRNVHSIIPDQREWLSVVACVNAAGHSIPNFYILKGVQFRRNYIDRCEEKATMAMARKACMSGPLFYAWLTHFIARVKEGAELSVTSRHLLILDGHNSHMTLEVIHKAAQAGIDMVTLPSHTSHALQPLDVSVFAPFKKAFRNIRDEWVLRNGGRVPTKEDLAEWVYKGLKKASTKKNIQSGFRAIGIYPLQRSAVDGQLGPSEGFQATDQVATAEKNNSRPHQCTNATIDDDNEGDHEINRTVSQQTSDQECHTPESPGGHESDVEVPTDEENGTNTETQYTDLQYYVQLQDMEQSTSADDRVLPFESDVADADEPHVQAEDIGIRQFLVLPNVAPVKRRKTEALVDYSKSLIVTSASHIAAVEELARQREVAAAERIQNREAILEKRAQRERNKVARLAEKQVVRADRDALKAAKQRERQTARAVKEALRASKQAEKDAQKASKMAEKEALKAMKQAKKDAVEARKAAVQEAKRARMEGPRRFNV
jgi:hypothetical protein